MRRFATLILISTLLLGAGCLRTSSKPSAPSASVSTAASSIQALPFSSADKYIPSDSLPVETSPDTPAAEQGATTTSGERASASKNIVVSSLIDNQILPNPFIILGRGRAFENVVSWRVTDSHHQVLAQGSIMTNAKDVGLYGSFRVRAFYDHLPSTDTGFVEVFTASPKDGSDQDMVRFPVRFPSERTVLKIYFPNVVKDPGSVSCEVTYPVTRRVVKTQNTAEAALLELIKGATAEEQTSGSRTSIIPGTTLRSVSIDDKGVATVDFSRELSYGIAGSCVVQALRSEITQTLKQFPNIKVVKILVEGSDAQLEP
ncbi:MAG: GerMN domain-containing protein [Patescibacteria group bacterium]